MWKVSFDNPKLVENVRTLTESIVKARPVALKGKYVRRVTVATTMSPGIDVDPASGLMPSDRK